MTLKRPQSRTSRGRLTALSQAASLQGHYTDAVKLALAAWPRSAADGRPMLSRTIDALAAGSGGTPGGLAAFAARDVVHSATFSPTARG